MAALPPLRKYRVAGVASFILVLVLFAAAAVLELSSPGSALTREVHWAGVASVGFFWLLVHLSLFRVVKLRGASDAERRQTRSRVTWGGPIGALIALWDLTESRAPPVER